MVTPRASQEGEESEQPTLVPQHIEGEYRGEHQVAQAAHAARKGDEAIHQKLCAGIQQARSLRAQHADRLIGQTRAAQRRGHVRQLLAK